MSIQFDMIVHRVQASLEGKYALIFRGYLKDLDSVLEQYEAQKADPPRPRDAPLVAGNIMWARNLLALIEGPMKRCAAGLLLRTLRVMHNAAFI